MLCGIDGCKFSAHPLLVEKHIGMQHRTGLYQRMKDLSTPEDIEKWIMERKRRYPTEDNIKLRKAEELEKLQRGEVIKQNSNTQTKIKKTNAREKRRKPRKRRAPEINKSYVHKEETYRGLRPFAGITDLQEDSMACFLDEQVGQDLCEKVIDNISDEDDVPQASTATELPLTNLPVTSSSVLASLVADYESEDNDEEGPEEVPAKKIKMGNLQEAKITENIIHEKTSIQACEEVSNTQSYEEVSNTQSYEEVSNTQSCADSGDKSNNTFQNTIAKNKDKQNCEPNRIVINDKNKKILRKYHNKLLEKLLSRSIQHERNLICQCVKYIVENNFFDIN